MPAETEVAAEADVEAEVDVEAEAAASPPLAACFPSGCEGAGPTGSISSVNTQLLWLRLSPCRSRVEIGLIAPFTLDATAYGNVQGSRDHSSATALHHVFTTVYDTWGDSRPTAAKKAAATPKPPSEKCTYSNVHMTANSAVLRLFRTTGKCNSVIQGSLCCFIRRKTART